MKAKRFVCVAIPLVAFTTLCVSFVLYSQEPALLQSDSGTGLERRDTGAPLVRRDYTPPGGEGNERRAGEVDDGEENDPWMTGVRKDYGGEEDHQTARELRVVQARQWPRHTSETRHTAEKAGQSSPQRYTFIPYETPHLPQANRGAAPAYALCRSIYGGIPPFGELLRDQRGWRDSSASVAAALSATDFKSLPPTLARWCGLREKRSTLPCIAHAIASPASPWGNLRILYCNKATLIRNIQRGLLEEGLKWPDRLLVYGAAQEFGMGEKTGLFVKRLPSLTEEQQKLAYQYAPRAYLASIDCAGPKEDDQWDLWLEDYFDGDVEKIAAHSRGREAKFRVSDVEVWREKQSIDLGKYVHAGRIQPSCS